MKNKKSVKISEYEIIEIEKPKRIVVRCPSCGALITTIGYDEECDKELSCLTCHAEYKVIRKK